VDGVNIPETAFERNKKLKKDYNVNRTGTGTADTRVSIVNNDIKCSGRDVPNRVLVRYFNVGYSRRMHSYVYRIDMRPHVHGGGGSRLGRPDDRTADSKSKERTKNYNFVVGCTNDLAVHPNVVGVGSGETIARVRFYVSFPASVEYAPSVRNRVQGRQIASSAT